MVEFARILQVVVSPVSVVMIMQLMEHFVSYLRVVSKGELTLLFQVSSLHGAVHFSLLFIGLQRIPGATGGKPVEAPQSILSRRE